MQKQAVFKVKGMQRDLSMANADQDYAYEILNMRLMPNEDLSGFSLTNEKGATLVTNINLLGQVIGQCPTTNSLIVFTTGTSDTGTVIGTKTDCIYEIYQNDSNDWEWKILYSGDLKFDTNNRIEALFNYETENIQKVYWIDGINPLRCINIKGIIKEANDTQFDSVKGLKSIPSVEIERVEGGSFTAGVLQYYITYFNRNSAESPIVYISPLLYIADKDRGIDVNSSASTAIKLTLTDLDTDTWDYIKIYSTHRTSLNAVPEASIIGEFPLFDSTIEIVDNGINKVSIVPTDLYFKGGKFVKAGTMTAKDQVLFLGHLDIKHDDSIDTEKIKELLSDIVTEEESPFNTSTTKTRENYLYEYEGTSYYYKNQLMNTKSITHYKYGEKYRFGISVLDKYGQWSDPIWLKDDFIGISPKQINKNLLRLSCPTLYLLKNNHLGKSLIDKLVGLGVIAIRPLVVYPSVQDRKILAQGVVCPTIYNLSDRKENAPYSQASWFMRPNAPVDIWGVKQLPINLTFKMFNDITFKNASDLITIDHVWHYSDLMESNHGTTVDEIKTDPRAIIGCIGVASSWEDQGAKADGIHNTPLEPWELMLDDTNAIAGLADTSYYKYVKNGKSTGQNGHLWKREGIFSLFIGDNQVNLNSGCWVEFRHNYALRSKGYSFGGVSAKPVSGSVKWDGHPFCFGRTDITVLPARELGGSDLNVVNGGHYAAEVGSTRYSLMLPVNRLQDGASQGDPEERLFRRHKVKSDYMTGNSAFYVDNSIVTLNTPELEFSDDLKNFSTDSYNFRIVGLIPITATSSDCSLIVDNPSQNRGNSANTSQLGLAKYTLSNINIGPQGFKGVVSNNTYSAYTPEDPPSPNTVSLNPWHTTGTIQRMNPTNASFGTSTLLKRKILSNLRYSASTYYFEGSNFDLCNSEKEDDNKAYIDNNLLCGWKPRCGSVVETFSDQDNDTIIKLQNRYKGIDWVYKGNIRNSIAIASTDNGNTSLNIMTSGIWDIDPLSSRMCGAADFKFAGKGASINYKSSPHFVVSFNLIKPSSIWKYPLETWEEEVTHLNVDYVQEILPTFYRVNASGLPADEHKFYRDMYHRSLYENIKIGSIPHQSLIVMKSETDFGLPGYPSKVQWYNEINDSDLYEDDTTGAILEVPGCIKESTYSPLHGWLWLGEIYKDSDPDFGGISDYSLQNNAWETAGPVVPVTSLTNVLSKNKVINSQKHYVEQKSVGSHTTRQLIGDLNIKFDINPIRVQMKGAWDAQSEYTSIVNFPFSIITDLIVKDNSSSALDNQKFEGSIQGNHIYMKMDECISERKKLEIIGNKILLTFNISLIYHMTDSSTRDWIFEDICMEIPNCIVSWEQGDTYYQRFDTLKTYAYSDNDQNSIVDITSFMVETRINIDGRTDRNRGNTSNLQASPSNFNLINNIYSQKDDFFTYRALDKSLRDNKYFPLQITWSLAKTAGELVDSWMNISLANVLNLEGNRGKISALKTFNSNIIAFQEEGISNILFNSRVQISTSEAVPIQIANSGKVDGQQYLIDKIGCQDKWNIVTTPNGLYFIDYFNEGIYRFNGKVENISISAGFRTWCHENLNSFSNIIGYYDVKNKEVMYYIGDTRFTLNQQYEKIEEDGTISMINIKPNWLGFSELTNSFSSFYTYPKSWFISIKGEGVWLLSSLDSNYSSVTTKAYTHQTGNYNQLDDKSDHFYGLTVIPRQNSNTVKIFNNVEFRADSFKNDICKDDILPFDTVTIETEYQPSVSKQLSYNKYKPSSLKKKFRTWRVNLPRANKYERFTNQWAKIGLWKMKPDTEKAVLHDLSVWYS